MQPNLQASFCKNFLLSAACLLGITHLAMAQGNCTNTYLVWNDCNGDGQKGLFEDALEGVNVTLFDANCQQVRQVTTNVNGNYTFGNLLPSTFYTVVFGNGQFANGVLNVGGKSHNLTLANVGAETTDSDAQLGGRPPGCVGGKPYIQITTDASGCVDGLLDAGFVKLDFQVNNIVLTHETCVGNRNGSISIGLSNVIGGYSATITNGSPMTNGSTFNNLTSGRYDIEIRSFTPTCNGSYKTSVSIIGGLTVAPPTVTNDTVCRYEVSSQNGGLKAICAPCLNSETPIVTWWTSQNGGSKLFTGNTFNPLAQNMVNPAEVGTTSFWAQCACGGCSSARVKADFVVKPRPEPRITGELFPCPESVRTYSTPSVSGNNYVWSLPDGGGTIVSTNNNAVTVRWQNLAGGGPYTVRVVETNSGGCFQTNDLRVAIKETQFACIGSINGSLDSLCQFDLTDYILLRRHFIGSETYVFQFKTVEGRILEEGVGHVIVDGIDNNGSLYSYIGKRLIYNIIEPCGGNSCSGFITLEDRTAPTISSPKDITLSCSQVSDDQTPLPVLSGSPTVFDCSSTETSFYDMVREVNCTQPFTTLPNDMATLKAAAFPTTGDIVKIILRTFLVRDFNNNTSTCLQYIFIRKNRIENVICPADFTLDCRYYRSDGSIAPSVTGAPVIDMDGDLSTTLDRLPIGIGSCKMNVTRTDQRVAQCANSFTVIRTWVIFDPCAINNPQTTIDERFRQCTQTILVADKTPPSVSAQFTQYYTQSNDLVGRDTMVSFDGFFDLDNNATTGTVQTVWALGNTTNCGGKTRLTFRMKDESCTRSQVSIRSDDSRVPMVAGYPQYDATTGETVAVFEASYATYGDYNVTFTASDECGFAKARKTFRIKVRDNIKPNVVCLSLLQVSLNTAGNARAYVEAFNNGSTDNCGIEKLEIRRMLNCQNTEDTLLKPYIDFNCCDINTPVQVILRVWDINGNYNECMATVNVSDKFRPVCTPLLDKTIACTDYTATNIQSFGTPTFWDNCRVKDTVYTEIQSLNNCKVGTLLRKWVISDAGGLKDSCLQRITIRGKSDFTVDFPDDIVANCFASVLTREQAKAAMLSNGPNKDGHIVNNGCGVLAVEVEDDTLTTVPDACYKILRKITVVDWCKFNPNNYDRYTGCYGLPVCGDVHSNPDWATQNIPSWQILNRPTCTNPSERRFRDADDLGGLTAPYSPYAFSDGMICYTQIIKIVDNVAPEFAPCPKDTVIKSFAALGCKEDVKLTIAASDLCAEGRTTNTDYLLFKWSIIDSATNQTLKAGYGNSVFEAFEFNRNYRVVWSVEDRCGNRTFCQQKVKVVDVKKPAVVCKDVNAALVRMPNGSSMVQVWATDLLASQLSDNCSSVNYLQQHLVVEKDSLSVGNYPSVLSAFVTFNCAEADRTVSIRLWTRDEAGNADYCIAKVRVQDNANVCNNQTVATIRGTVKNENDAFIAGVNITATMSGTTIGTVMTNSTSTFSINNLLSGNNYVVRASRDDLPLNGVTTFDLALMSKHILGVAPLSTPCRIIAGDVNRDGELSGLDMLYTRRMILRLQTTFPNGTPSWRFIDKRYVFLDRTDPLAEDFPEVVNIMNAPLASEADFIGFKVGDVSGNAWVGSASAMSTSLRSTRKALILNTNDMAMIAGKTYRVKFSCDDFNAEGFQFTLNHTEGVEIEKIEGSQSFNITENNFGRFKTALTTSWNGHFEGKTDNIFTILVRAKQNAQLSDVLTIGSNLTVAEAYNTDGEVLDVKLVFIGNALPSKGEERIGAFALYQNEPNPMDDQTKISFNLPTEAETKLTIYDAAGRILKAIKQKFAKGYNEIRLSKEDINATGILYYRLDTPTNTATKKMIIIP